MTVTIPETPEELTEMLGDSAKMQDLMKEKKFGEFVKAYSDKVAKKDPGIMQQITEEKERSQQTLAAVLKEFGTGNTKRPNLGNLNFTEAPRNTLYNKRAPGAKVDESGLLTEPGDFLNYYRTIWHRNNTAEALENRAKLDKIRNDYGTTAPSDGGFLVPETLRAELLRVSLETAVVRSRARVIPMDALRVPFPTIDATSHASNVHGGVTGYWTEESAVLTESQATFGRVVLQANKLTAYAEVPNELFAESIISFAAFVEQVYPEAIAWFEDIGFFNGSGAGEPLGFLRAAAAVETAKEGGQPADTIVWENIVKMYARMLPTSLGRCQWIANIDTFPQLATMSLSVGTGGSAIWLNNGTAGPPMTILGRPVVFTEKAPTVGDAGDINLVDFSYYLIGDRQSMTGMTSPHYKFPTDQTAIRFTQRVDGRPWITNAITPQTGTNTLSPFVKIAARA